ncbi:MAG: hypothetical protein QNJ78_14330 [Gammaproteobacteria bacterium]|nr:hypothetical protein [Gammaproteobacteria bacterium]
MRIVDAEAQLINDFIDEIEVTATKKNPSLTVQVGRHPILGKVVVIETKQGDNVIVEVDE